VKNRSISTSTQPSPTRFEAVPLLDLQRQYASIREEVLPAIERVCSSQHFILGPEVSALEKELPRFTGSTNAVGCGSGTDALWLALLACGVGPGDYVITTPFSFFASASAIVRTGARPVFVDIDPATFNMDCSQLEQKLRSGSVRNLKAIVPVHLFGQCADMGRLEKLCREFGVAMVEDAAQAIGAAWQGRRAGAWGGAAAFSFYPTKNLSAYGDAGAVTTSDPERAEHMRRLRNHGSPRRYYHEEFGWNSRLDEIQAAVLRVKLPHVEAWNDSRRERAASYDRLFVRSGLAATAPSNRVSHAVPVEIPYRASSAHHVFHQYVIRADRRDELRQFLTQRRIGTEVYYPVPLHLQSCFEYLGYRAGDLPEAERAASELLALPIFPELTEAEQTWVVESIVEFYS